ncbi:hypothetical protein JCM15765_06610 [Paradesulfitobacterium aromaticivorans]
MDPGVLEGVTYLRGVALREDYELDRRVAVIVFAGGDVVLGPASVIEAIAQGRQVAGGE